MGSASSQSSRRVAYTERKSTVGTKLFALVERGQRRGGRRGARLARSRRRRRARWRCRGRCPGCRCASGRRPNSENVARVVWSRNAGRQGGEERLDAGVELAEELAVVVELGGVGVPPADATRRSPGCRGSALMSRAASVRSRASPVRGEVGVVQACRSSAAMPMAALPLAATRSPQALRPVGAVGVGLHGREGRALPALGGVGAPHAALVGDGGHLGLLAEQVQRHRRGERDPAHAAVELADAVEVAAQPARWTARCWTVPGHERRHGGEVREVVGGLADAADDGHPARRVASRQLREARVEAVALGGRAAAGAAGMARPPRSVW